MQWCHMFAMFDIGATVAAKHTEGHLQLNSINSPAELEVALQLPAFFVVRLFSFSLILLYSFTWALAVPMQQ